MQHQVIKIDSKGNLSDCGDFGSPVFEGEDGIERAMDLRNYLGEDYVVFTEPHKGYRIFRRDFRTHALILDGNTGPDVTDPGHYIAYDYLSNGDGFGRKIFCGAKEYKSFKGACKKVYQYLH